MSLTPLYFVLNTIFILVIIVISLIFSIVIFVIFFIASLFIFKFTLCYIKSNSGVKQW